MSSLKLASAGDDIKIWDINSFSLIKQFNPHDHNVCDVCWSHDNRYLASVSSNEDRFGLAASMDNAYRIVDLTFISSHVLVLNVLLTSLEGKQYIWNTGRNFVDYSSSSRYILTGTDKVINAWDLRTRSLRKTYKGHSGVVTCAQFNWNDSYIASASVTGEIIVYNGVTGQGCSPMIAPKVQSIKQIQYNQFKKSLLGSVSDDGAVNLWDTNTRRLIHSFAKAHRAPATGINFSPINDIFLMSVGLDKRIACFDVEAKKCLKTIFAESPLTSVDVTVDGVTVAVGSTRGKIYIYDLRQSETPVKVLNAHKSSVQSLKFQTNFQNDVTTKSKPPTTTEVSPTGRRQLPSAPRDQGEEIQYSNMHTVKDTTEGDVFSPVQNRTNEMQMSGEIHQDSGVDNSSSLLPSYRQEEFSSDADSIRRSVGPGISPMFSQSGTERSTNTWDAPPPLNFNNYTTGMNGVGSPSGRSASYTGSTAANYSSPPLTSSYTSHPGPDPVSTTSQNNPPNTYIGSSQELQRRGHSEQNSHTSITNGGSPQSYSQSSRTQNVYKSSPDRPVILNSEQPTGISASDSVPCVTLDSPSATAGADLIPAIKSFSSPDGAHALPTSQNNSRHYGRHLDSSATEKVQSQNFQTQLLRSIVHEALEDFRDQIHEEIQNLHLEMLRQFQLQQNELNHLLQHYSVNQDLVKEVERLREENKMLKKNF